MEVDRDVSLMLDFTVVPDPSVPVLDLKLSYLSFSCVLQREVVFVHRGVRPTTV